MSEIIFKDLSIEYICNPKLKNSYLSVKKDSKIVVKTPKVSQKFILNFVKDKESWIRKQLLKLKDSAPIIVNLEDEVLLFGELYSIDSEEVTELRESLLRVKNANKEKILTHYDRFYKSISLDYLTKRVEYFAKLMNLEYKEIRFKKMRSRWGSCNTNRVITLNTQLIKVKKELIDYVVIHELSHLVHMNHSKVFHSFVSRYIENSKELRKELKNINLIDD